MFLQLFLGKVTDPDGVRRQFERWERDVAPGAGGWLGSTGGVTGDRNLVLATSFASAEAAADHARRAEQVAWWADIGESLDGPPTVLETEDITVQRVGDPTEARFVQAMRATVADRARFEAVEDRIGPAFIEHRPDFLLAYRIWFGETTLVSLDYFRSEAEARAGEAKDMSDELAAGFGEWQALVGAAEWYDLTDPWLAWPT